MGETNSNGKLKIDTGLAVQLVAWIVAVLVAYGMVRVDVAVLRNQVDTLKSDVSEIKSDVKTLLRGAR